jgi:glycosyltransferase involved in cell wall biosynthesis/GT2 family glycosyltransferase
MKIGFELGPLAPSDGDLLPVLQGVLGTLFASHPEQRAVLFCTPAHAELFPALPPAVERVVLPEEQFFPRLSRQLARRRLSVLFRPRPAPGGLSLARQVVLVHDLRHEFFWEQFSADELRRRHTAVKRVLQRAGALAALTDHGRQTLRSLALTRDVFVMRPALPADRPPASVADLTDDERRHLPPGDFFLYPADLDPHRNHRRLLRAFERFTRRAPGRATLVLTGNPSGWDELTKGLADLPVQHLGRVRPEFLDVLYRRARALVYPALDEATGLPLLEAFRAGTPVVCGSAGTTGEVAGDAALTCDPADVEAMSQALLRVAHDDALCGRLVARGRERLACYDWHDGARNLLDACHRVVEAAARRPRIVRRAWAVVQRAGAQLRYYADRTALLLKPKLGVYRQYEPRPLALPAHYAAETTPDPAPVISVVTPSFNQGTFLERTLRSVLDQNYPRLEFVVQDGGSSDGSAAILERYAGRLAHWESAADRGQAHAINLGFRHATGDILAYLNSDDLLLPGSLAYVANYFARHPETDVVYGHRVIIDADDREVGRCVLPPHDDEFITWDDYVPQETLFWRRRVWERVGGRLDESFHFALDWDLILRFRKAGAKFVRLPRFLGAFRVQPEQKTLNLFDAYYPEIRRLRERSHTRPVPHQLIVRAQWSYLRRQGLFQQLYGLGLLRY